MYTFLITDDDAIIPSTRERIMQRSNAVNNIRFLVSPTYNGYDMTNYTATIEYVLPVSKEYKTETLVLSQETTDQGYLEYKLPLKTKLTREAGNIEIQLTFIWLEMTVDGETEQHVRKTSSVTLPILPIQSWSDIIPDDALTSLDQRLIKLQSLANQLADIQESTIEYVDTKADDIKLDVENGNIYLTSEGERVGNPISLNDFGDALSENTKDGLTFVLTDDEEPSDDAEKSQYTLKLNQETNELYLLSNGIIVSKVSAQELGESIIESTKDEGTNEVLI